MDYVVAAAVAAVSFVAGTSVGFLLGAAWRSWMTGDLR